MTIDQALQQGVAAHKEGKLHDAERLYRAILQAQPKHPDANHNLGVLAVAAGKPLEAIPLLKLALEANPEIEQFWISYVDALIKVDRLDEAREVLASGEQSGVSTAKLEALQQHLQVGVPNDAIKGAQTLTKKRKTHAEKKKNKKRKAHLGSSGSEPSQDQLKQLITHYQAGRLEEAKQLAISLTRQFPNHPFGWKVLGAVLEQAGRLEESLAPTKKSIELSPQDAPAHYNLGLILSRLDRLVEAEASFKKALALKPDYAEARNNLGIILHELARLDEAEEHFEQAISTKPDFAEAYSNLGNVLREKGRLEAAIATYQQAISYKRGYAEAQYNLGVALKELGSLDDAIASYRKAIAIQPAFGKAYCDLGVTLQERGKLDEAVENLMQAVALNPNYALARSNLGLALRELGRLDEAKESLSQAAALQPGSAATHFNLGITLQDLGRLDEAEASFVQSLAVKPDFTEAKDALIELLTSYDSRAEIQHPIVRADREIKSLRFTGQTSRIVSDDEVVTLFIEALGAIKDQCLRVDSNLSQAYRRNAIDLNCKRHMAIFNEFDIIPEFCFGCYKVQVEPRSALELIKLLLVFDQLALDQNNTRKCMIEARPEISGFYKGLIYCSSIEEASAIANILEGVVKEKIGPGLKVLIKRGCSEYAISFPDYKDANPLGPPLMSYPADWKLIEQGYDSRSSIISKKNIQPTFTGLSLSDVLVVQNWWSYARGIGDDSLLALNPHMSLNQKIYQTAKIRLSKYPWR